jgi:hypothetical protein
LEKRNEEERNNTDSFSKSTKFPSSEGTGPENRLLSMLLKYSPSRIQQGLNQMKLCDNFNKEIRAYRDLRVVIFPK